MKVRPLAICTADFPDDSVETEDGKGFLDHGGRNVAEAIAEILSRLGCTIAPPENAGMYGWRFDWAFQGQGFLCQVSSIPPEHYLHFEGASLGREVSPKNHRTAEIFTALNAELARDGRFHDVLWYPSVGGTIRLENEAAATDPLAPAPPMAHRNRSARRVLFLLGCFLMLEVIVSIYDHASVTGVATFVLAAMLLLVGSGIIKPQWPWPSSERPAPKADGKAPRE